MTLTGATLFTGFGGADIGMQMVGITPLWGIERTLAIADVARMNGIPVTTADILDCDPAEFPRVDVLHASPPCTNFSIAKTNAEETKQDIELGKKVAQFITELKPKVFILENVWRYRNSVSWHIICASLYEQGYWVAIDRVNFADYGVPQSRKRMIVRAIRGVFFGVPLPEKEKWNGWYEAVEDLIPTFETTQFAPWQIARMTSLECSFLVDSTNAIREFTQRDVKSPSFTITASSMRRPSSSPMAYLIDEDSSLTHRADNEPSITILANAHRRHRVFEKGKVVRLTPRALARLQSFPDSYKLPENNKLACRGIGNACPPVGMAKILNCLSTVATTDKTNLNNQIQLRSPKTGDCKEDTYSNPLSI